jgi:hypothetical protein
LLRDSRHAVACAETGSDWWDRGEGRSFSSLAVKEGGRWKALRRVVRRFDTLLYRANEQARSHLALDKSSKQHGCNQDGSWGALLDLDGPLGRC